MATYFVYSAAAGTNNGTSWTNAYTAISSAITAATTAGDIIKVHKTHQEQLAADTIYTLAASIFIISVDKDASDALAVMSTGGWLGNSTTNRAITFTGNFKTLMYGITMRISGSTAELLALNVNGDINYESCYFWQGNTNSNSGIVFGSNDSLTRTRCKDCTFRFGATTNFIQLRGDVEIEGGSVSSAGSIPGTLFFNTNADPGGTNLRVEGFDMTHMVGATLVGNCTAGTLKATFTRCKLATGYAKYATQTSTGGNSAEVFLYDCATSDSHIEMEHQNALGNTTVDYNSIWVTADAEQLAWIIETSANANFRSPYISPWIFRYNSDVSTAIQPWFEILRNGSTTPFQDDEVWGEWSYKGTSGSTNSTFVNDRMTLLGTPADQAAGTGTGNWSGEGGSAWSGKLQAPASFTPAEIGHIRGRIMIAEPSILIYASPRIRI